MTGIVKPKSAAEALACRYRAQSWFVFVTIDDAGLVLKVHPSCPFRTHRKVMGYDVRVAMAAEARKVAT